MLNPKSLGVCAHADIVPDRAAGGSMARDVVRASRGAGHLRLQQAMLKREVFTFAIKGDTLLAVCSDERSCDISRSP